MACPKDSAFSLEKALFFIAPPTITVVRGFGRWENFLSQIILASERYCGVILCGQPVM